MTGSIASNTIPMVALTGSRELLSFFLPLFGSGVRLQAALGCSIRELLCGQYAVDSDYLDDRIQTVFLDGKAVDNVDESMVSDGAVLALSAAMPGLAGATLRKGGRYAALRRPISHLSSASGGHRSQGTVVLKLFNLVCKELGPHFLSRGVVIPGKTMRDAADGIFARMETGSASLAINGRDIRKSEFAAVAWHFNSVLLKLKTA